jgi:N-methylhydantoinase A
MNTAVSKTAAGLAPARAPAAAGKLINIDNGGTLTDICVIDGTQVYRTKTITTPYDLSKCLLEGLSKVSAQIYGNEDIQALLLSTEYIRYSTTQGTNALVERKGPRLGLIVGGTLAADKLRDAGGGGLFDAIVGERVAVLDAKLEGEAREMAVTRAVTQLASSGANRIVVACGGTERNLLENELKRTLLRKFPQHLLGAVPILYSHEVVEDGDDVRRAWTALLNAFLHPAMERFLYSAERKLRDYKTRNPLLIFRNDGYSARVAKTIAIKTYSSGPRGGAEGARALAAHYGFKHLLSMDVGGTTTDILEVRDGEVRVDVRGQVEGVTTSFPLSAVVSVGVGGSSVIKVESGKVDNGKLKVGPESVGGAPGPACFGLGGTLATITDAVLVQGLLDPATYFGGQLRIDAARARAAIEEHIAKSLGMDVDAAAAAMVDAWIAKIAKALKDHAKVTADTTLAAFGGAGPLLACRVAEAAGIRSITVPALAPVFSAFGIGFSDVGHEYELPLPKADAECFAAVREQLVERARRGMFAEGAELDDCTLQFTLKVGGEEDRVLGADPSWPADVPAKARVVLSLLAVKPITHTQLKGGFGKARAVAKAAGTRSVAGAALPLYRAADLAGGAAGEGPAVIEDDFFTAQIDAQWKFEINESGDLLLQRAG